MILKDIINYTKVNKFIFIKIARVVLFLCAFLYLLHSVVQLSNEQFEGWLYYIQIHKYKITFLIIVLFLSLVNWGLESFKWKLLAGKLQKISFSLAFKGVLAGVAMGMLTPKRIGEFAGKVIVLEKNNRLNGIVINSAASICQLLTTIIAGSLSLLLLITYSDIKLSNIFYFSNQHFILIAGILFFSFLAFCIRKKLISFLLKFRPFLFVYRKIRILKTVTRQEFLKLFLLSGLRYIVFMTQCFLLFSLTGLKLTFYEVFLFQSIVFFLMTVLPVTAFSELAVKGGLAVFLFGIVFSGSLSNYYGYELSLIIANGLLWLVNLAIPAIVGLFWSSIKFNQKII